MPRSWPRAREQGVPVVHVVTSYHSVEEIASNPWWSAVADTDASRANVLRHQLPGSAPVWSSCPTSRSRLTTWSCDTKKRYDCFTATELDHVLRARAIDTLLLTGVNTNSCVLATTIAANARDYAAVVVEDCVDTMDQAAARSGPARHPAGVRLGSHRTEEVLAAL